ncbi:hypothetical protein D3C72_1370020 [compost metagenome]
MPACAPTAVAQTAALLMALLGATTASASPCSTSIGGSVVKTAAAPMALPTAVTGIGGTCCPRMAPSAVADDFAAPGATPECMTTARKRFG